ncbi:MAG: ABC transporter substrate-binding protein [Pseudomonadota bacterium]
MLTLAVPATAEDCAEGQRAFEHAEGTACIPNDPQRVVSGNEFWISIPLVELGAPLVGTAGWPLDDARGYVGRLRQLGLEHLLPGDIPRFGRSSGMDFEAIAALAPDLIVTTIYEADLHDRFEIIAPTVVVPRGLLAIDHLAFIADAVGAQDTHDTLITAYQSRVAAVRAQLPAPEEIVVSRLDINDNGLRFFPNFGTQDQVINDLGFSRPPMQRDATTDIRGVSIERIAEFDGDIILSGYAPRFGQTVDMIRSGWMADGEALWTQLEGVRAGNHYWYEGDTWNAIGYHFLTEVLTSLATITVGQTFE